MQDKPTLYRAAQHGFIHPPKEADDGGDNNDDGGDNDGGIGLICQEMWY